MKIHINQAVQNNLFSADAINMSAANKTGVRLEDRQKDQAAISPLGKAGNLLNNLMKQRQDILDRKNELMNKALEDGSSPESVQAEMETYNQLLKDLDDQISKATADQATKQAEKEEEKKQEPMTKEEYMANRLNSVVDLSADVEKAETIQSIKGKLDGTVRVLKSEVAQDGSRTTPQKLERISNLERKSRELMDSLSQHLGDIHNKAEQPVVTEQEIQEKEASEEEVVLDGMIQDNEADQ